MKPDEERRIYTAKELGLKSDSFVDLGDDRDVVRRALINVEGAAKSGKTDWCLRNLPDPIIVFNFDNGLRGMVEKFRRKPFYKTIIPAGMPLTEQQKKDGIKHPSYAFMRPVPERGEGRKSDAYMDRVRKSSRPIWERFISDYVEFLNNPRIKSGIVDTGGHCYQLAKFAQFGTDKMNDMDIQRKSGDLKSLFQGIVTDAYMYNKYVVWTHRLKDEWASGGATGGFVLDGYKQMLNEVEYTLRVKRKTLRGETEWTAELRDNRLGKGSKLNGLIFGGDDEDNPRMTLPAIMSTLFPHTDEAYWKQR